MANQLLTRQEITRKVLFPLVNRLKIVRNFTRDYDQEFGKKGAKIGSTLYVRRPWRPVGRTGQAFQAEPLSDTQMPITINRQRGVDFEASTDEMYTSIDDLANRYLDKAGVNIASMLDYDAGQMAYQNTFNLVGTVGTTPGLSGSDAFQTYSQALQKLLEAGMPDDGKKVIAVIDPAGRTGWIV